MTKMKTFRMSLQSIQMLEEIQDAIQQSSGCRPTERAIVELALKRMHASINQEPIPKKPTIED